jgi:4-hydroxy-3-methylbut-2-en-1-yl diphosphate reductase
MKVLLANPRGFCAGVEMAVTALERMVECFPPPVYCFHHVVHNENVVRHFEQRGVIFVDDIAEIPRGATVAFSAHGVSPAVRDETVKRQLHVVDLTCPLVTKVHREARRFAREGRMIALIGRARHDEVVGVTGEAPDRIVVVESAEDVRHLPDTGGDAVAYLTQTTLSVTETRGVIDELRQRYPLIVGPSKADICYATQNRQDAVRALAREAELTLVIGSAQSSNTCHLVDVSRTEGSDARRIDGAHEIQPEWLDNVNVVAVTSGASVPEHLVQEVAEHLATRYGAQIEERSIGTERIHFAMPDELATRAGRRGREVDAVQLRK